MTRKNGFSICRLGHLSPLPLIILNNLQFSRLRPPTSLSLLCSKFHCIVELSCHGVAQLTSHQIIQFHAQSNHLVIEVEHPAHLLEICARSPGRTLSMCDLFTTRGYIWSKRLRRTTQGFGNHRRSPGLQRSIS